MLRNITNYFSNKTERHLFYWTRANGQVNFGDLLSRDIVEALLIRKGLSLKSKSSGRLLALGSIIHYARERDTIWGSGINFKLENSFPSAKHLDIRSVRGLLTKKALESRGFNVPNVFGDPGILLKDLFEINVPAKKEYEYLILPNLNDLSVSNSLDQRLVISPTEHWINVVSKISKCNVLITSSLHGIILCEVLGINYRFIRIGETEDLRKYEDYYTGTGRDDYHFYTSVGQALAGSQAGEPHFKKNELINSFPYDLWQKNVI